MDLKGLLSGIAVVIDDRIGIDAGGDRSAAEDPIVEIVQRLEQEWNLPCYRASSMPPEEMWPGLLQTASFVLLDWKLWPPNAASQLEQVGIEKNVRFLKQAKEYFVPVFIFTNDAPEDVKDHLPQAIYNKETAEKSFVFIQRKSELLSNDDLNLKVVDRWMRGNASVYALKAWNRTFLAARKELFGSMYAKSADWPKLFWKAYKDDSVDPGSSLTHLINDNLRGRMRTGSFDPDVLAAGVGEDVSMKDLRALIAEVSFQSKKAMPDNEIRCGDLFRRPKGRFLLNVRPDCDCVPRDTESGEVDLYCIEGRKMSDSQLGRKVQHGQIVEGIAECIIFAVCEGRSVRFDFKKLSVEKFKELKEDRVGRVLHPYLTRLQQRYALFLQRQGLPRIPEGALPGQHPGTSDQRTDTEKTSR